MCSISRTEWWHYLGVDSDYFEVREAESGDFHARLTVRERSSNNKWNLATVYGAAHGRDKGACLVELVHIFYCNELPLLVGGDFNLIRKISDSSRARRLNKWSNLLVLLLSIVSLRRWSMYDQDENIKKCHLVNWQEICQPRKQGGLGVLDLSVLNTCLLSMAVEARK